MLRKIRDALTPTGVFTGSESLGRVEGQQDHLRFFDTLDDLSGMLRAIFPHVEVREASYPLGKGLIRREGYWRCAMDAARLESPWAKYAKPSTTK